jgi:hypothetical protein
MPIVLRATVESRSGRHDIEIPVRELVLAGWTGRDKAAVEHHIRELEALGVKPPATTPIYYRVSAARVTTDSMIEVPGEDSSGEVEFVVVSAGGELLLGTGSDHTDRKAETFGITLSKQLCDKPVAATFWPLAEVTGHWDEMILRAHIVTGGKRELYQEGTLAKMLPLAELIRGHAPDGRLSDGCMFFGGTFAAVGGIRPADRFEGELVDPKLNRRIAFGYDIRTLPVRG